MSQFTRRAKSASEWTEAELRAYNITIVRQDAATFFGTPILPLPAIHEDILTALNPNDAVEDDNYELLRLMHLAHYLSPDVESAVDDFAVLLLRALGYTPRGKVLRTRMDIPLVICGENKHAQTDVCILDGDEIILLVQEDKNHMELSDPEPQLIAEAIAAFAKNNLFRRQILSQSPITSKVIAGITLTRTMPTFYKIQVTEELVVSVEGGVYPEIPTIVYAHAPATTRPHRRLESMKPLENRSVFLSCYEAFKNFVN